MPSTTEPQRRQIELLELTASGAQVLRASRFTFGEALEVYLGAAASAAELTRLSDTLGRIAPTLPSDRPRAVADDIDDESGRARRARTARCPAHPGPADPDAAARGRC